MSLTDEERGIIVELEIEKAYKTFKAVEVFLKGNCHVATLRD